MKTTLVSVERTFSPSFKGGGKLPWTTLCDGMPRLSGCGQEIETTRPYLRPGKKSTGWLITYGYDGEKDDKSYLCAFCPSCALVVEEQMRKASR